MIDIKNFLSSAIAGYLNFIKKFVLFVDFNKYGSIRVGLGYRTPTAEYDNKLARLDKAKEMLLEAMLAIDDLKEEAQKNREELQDLLLKLEKLNGDKSQKENELNEVKKILALDSKMVKELLGVPGERAVQRERIFNFVTGVCTSLVATGLVWIIVRLI